VESWLEERGHSLVPLSNPGFKLEMGLESGEHGTLLGGWSDELGTLEQGDCYVAASCHSDASASRNEALHQLQQF